MHAANVTMFDLTNVDSRIGSSMWEGYSVFQIISS